MSGSFTGYRIKNTNYSYLTNPTTSQNQYIIWGDKDNHDLGYIQQGIGTSGNASMYFVASNYKTDGTRINCALGCHVNRDGSYYTSAFTPPTNDNSTQIATTIWVNNRITARLPQITYW